MKSADSEQSNDLLTVAMDDSEVKFFRKEDVLTPENVIGKFTAYLEQIDKQYGRALPKVLFKPHEGGWTMPEELRMRYEKNNQ